MQSRFRMKSVVLAALLAMVASVTLASTASAGPAPGAKPRGFRLFARALGAYTVNRIYCGISSDGEICRDSTGSSTIGGGFWPKGTADQYIFNTGMQIAGVIGPDGGPWAGDTTGGFFFDPKGTTQHGSQVEPIYNFQSPGDAAIWPAEACVPNGDAQASLFDPLLQTDPSNTADPTCRKTASEGDIWFVSTEADPTLKAGRKHPLGIVVETRLMGWNTPSENKDIAYLIYTFYNITSLNPADYAAVRPKFRNLLIQQAQKFHAAEVAQGVALPQGGYTLTQLYAAIGTDMDVAQANANYASVNLPFALGFTYDHGFEQPGGWTFDPSIFSGSFFPGVGFAGVKYLKSPTGPGAIQLYSNTINGTPFPGAFNDPQNTTQLWRYLSGNINQAAGDQACNTGNPAVSHVCFVNNNSPQDMRFFESSTGLTLGPGQAGTIVVAYIFAAPVKTPGCSGNCDVKPGNPLRLSSVDSLAVGPNLVDSLTGYVSFHDNNGNGIPEQSEFKVVKNSLLGKALVAQQVFDTKFLRPFAPSSPDFFLIPGNNQVTVLWRPSPSEQAGDPFFNIASQPTVLDAQGNVQPNGQYDPNYRQFDVEGYRVYRGRVDSPNELTLLAQFDYAGTQINDFTGQINPTPGCGPDIGIKAGCPVAFDSVGPGVAPTHSVAYPLVGDLTQVFLAPPSPTGNRVVLANDSILYLHLDTALVSGVAQGSCAPSACPPLEDTGVPFVYVDQSPKNSFRYFYSVTAFDINSFQSGPSSLESPRITKSVTPVAPATNYVNSGTLTSHVVGRGVATDTIFKSPPSLDGATGKFSGPFQPANGTTVGFVGQFVSSVIAAPGALSVTLDSLTMGNAWPCDATSLPNTYYYTASAGAGSTPVQLVIPIVQDCFDGEVSGSSLFNAVHIDNTLAGNYGGDSSYALKGQLTVNQVGTYHTGAWGRGCINGAFGFTFSGAQTGCNYNGTRWFDGPSPTKNEVTADPNFGNGVNGGGATVNTALANNAGWNNAGHLTGVDVAYQPIAYQTTANVWRIIHAALGGAVRAADYNVYWNAATAGLIDSVIDVTHNVPVAFDSLRMQSSYGVLTTANAAAAGSFDKRAQLSVSDFGCVAPFKTDAQVQSLIPCTGATRYFLTRQAALGAIVFSTGSVAADTNSTHTGTGFGMYLAGNLYLFQMAALPQNTVWSMRDYVGAITGGNGFAGNNGPYKFTPVDRPFSAVGAAVTVNFNVVNKINAPTSADLSKVHTVPDPYYVTNAFEQTTDNKVIKFVNLPRRAIIRIYSTSGILVALLEHNSTTFGGEETWNVRNRNNQVVASGVYFYHIESNDGGTARRVGRMTIVNFAQ